MATEIEKGFSIRNQGNQSILHKVASGLLVSVLVASVLPGCAAKRGQTLLGKESAVDLLPIPAKPGEIAAATASEVNKTVAGLAPQGADTKSQISTADGGMIEVSINGLNLKEAVGLAIARHPDISRAQALVAQSESEVAVAKSAWFQTIQYGVTPKYSRAVKNESYATVGVQQLVYDFGRSSSRVSAAQATLEGDKFQLADSIESIAYNTSVTFIELAASQETIAAAGRQVSSLQKTREKIESRVKAGLSDASDLNQAEVAIQRAEADVLAAQTDYDVAVGRLAEVAGVRPQRVESLDATSSLLAGLDGAAPAAIENTPAVLAAQAAARAAQERVKLARANRYPSIGVSIAQDISVLKDIYGDYQKDTWVGLELSGDISTGGQSRHEVSAAEAEARAQSKSLENERLAARTALGSAQTQAAGAAARLQSYESVIGLSRSLLDLYWQEYTLDKRPLTDVISAERDIYQSEVSRITAIADGNIARVKANAAVGRLVAQLKAGKNSSK
ncbi:MAG: TolC family protein [Rhizobiaceae bacterium]|nr:TolC family protein [Rhizobiaceae bacterium]